MLASAQPLFWALAFTAIVTATSAQAEEASPQGDPDSVSVEAEYSKRIRAAEATGGLGADLFGDTVNLYAGTVSFSATDVSVPSNFALPVSIGRRFAVAGGTSIFEHFGDWELDIWRIPGPEDAQRFSSVFGRVEKWMQANKIPW